MSLAFDEYGKPYIIIREQFAKKRVKGIEATRANLVAALQVAETLKS